MTTHPTGIIEKANPPRAGDALLLTAEIILSGGQVFK
jgi:hypothetical protein